MRSTGAIGGSYGAGSFGFDAENVWLQVEGRSIVLMYRAVVVLNY